MAEITFAATGDSIISQRVSRLGEKATGGLREIVRAADAAFTNIEIAIPKAPWIPAPESRGSQQGAPAYILDELSWYGFNLFGFANNHVTDYTVQGLMDALEAFEQRGLAVAGAGRSLGEARTPAYFETPAGRVAVIAAAATFTSGALAADPRSDMLGRPGLNPLRFETEYVLDARRLAALREIDEALGSAAAQRQSEAFGVMAAVKPGTHRFLGRSFSEGEAPAVRTRAHRGDLEGTARWVREARRQADVVAVSLHAHEGQGGDSHSDRAADFIKEAAHHWIDAGADVFIGHGPHRLRGIEIYQGKPIFYSLGNFFFQFETILRVPQEAYEEYGLGPEATPSDVADAWIYGPGGSIQGFHADPGYWRSILPVCRFEHGRLTGITVHAVDVGLDLVRSRRGTPRYAGRTLAEVVFEDLAQLCEPYRTRLRLRQEESRLTCEIEI